jgi:uncharacterized protein YrrD
MRPGKDLIGKPIYSIVDGRMLGNVKDLYLDNNLDTLNGIYLGLEGLIKRKALLIQRDDVVVFGIDAILVKNGDVVTDDKQRPEIEGWLRLDKLRGREVDTPGGTKVGTVGDVMVGGAGEITGFALARVYVEGPVAEWGTLPRSALVDTGAQDRTMTVDLTKVEQLYREQQAQGDAAPEGGEA